jgi:hypothetical protein
VVLRERAVAAQRLPVEFAHLRGGLRAAERRRSRAGEAVRIAALEGERECSLGVDELPPRAPRDRLEVLVAANLQRPQQRLVLARFDLAFLGVGHAFRMACSPTREGCLVAVGSLQGDRLIMLRQSGILAESGRPVYAATRSVGSPQRRTRLSSFRSQSPSNRKQRSPRYSKLHFSIPRLR